VTRLSNLPLPCSIDRTSRSMFEAIQGRGVSIYLMLLLAVPAVAVAQTIPAWVIHGKEATPYDVGVSPNGDVSIIGFANFFQADVNLGEAVIERSESTSVFIAKLDEAGRFVWGVPGGF